MGRKGRGASGLSLVCAIKKEVGPTSHDVVNSVRKIFGERRVGHAGTLDPNASGVMLIFIGPATRLSNHLIAHDKKYVARICFGASTDTEDSQGNITQTKNVPSCVLDKNFAQDYLSDLIGSQKQMPPVYSALKVNGKKACDEARRGNIIELKPRDIEIYSAKLTCVGVSDSAPFWDVEFHVSSGTYIRSLARDIGLGVGSLAHLCSLERTSIGNVSIHDCVSLQVLKREGARACIDPISLLRLRVAYLKDGECGAAGELDAAGKRDLPDKCNAVSNGAPLPANIALHDVCASKNAQSACACTTGVVLSEKPASDGEKIAIVSNNTLKAIYSFDAKANKFKPECVFSVGVSRGACL